MRNGLKSIVRAGVLVSIVAAILAADARSASAQARGGIRGGITDDPDSVFFGGHLALRLGRSQLRFEPSGEIGIDLGDVDFFTLRFNGNFKYMVPIGRGQAIYPLFGLAVYHLEFDGGADYTEVGVNLGFGFEISQIFFELGVGIEDIPDITFTLGYTF